MKLYYHKTDGGAEYYCLKLVEEGSEEGDMYSAVLRTDGNEFEIFAGNIKEHNIKIVIS